MTRRLPAFLLALVLLAGLGLATVQAQADRDELTLAGGLGSRLGQFNERFGAPDAEDGAVRTYFNKWSPLGNSIIVAQTDRGTVISMDVWLTDWSPAVAMLPRDVIMLGAWYAPLDSACDPLQRKSQFGPVTYRCHSEQLAGQLTAGQYAKWELRGEPGDFSYVVDPVGDDDQFHVVIRLGHSRLTGTAATETAETAKSGEPAATDTAEETEPAATAEPDETASLDGKLGGSKSSWDDAYGDPVNSETSTAGTKSFQYEASRMESVTVTFSDSDERAVDIFAILPASAAEDVRGAADNIAKMFSGNATCAADGENADDQIYDLCSSDALKSAFSSGDYKANGWTLEQGEFRLEAYVLFSGQVAVWLYIA